MRFTLLRGCRGDSRAVGDVSKLMRIWRGTTPDGYALLVEREGGGQWVVTVAAVSRSRNDSLEAALVEAGGSSVPSGWAAQAAKLIMAQATTGSSISVPSANGSRTGRE